MTKERVEKRRAEALILQAERQLKEVALDFGMQFERNRRQHIETLLQELRENLAPDDDWRIDQSYANLQDALFELNQQVRVYYTEDEQDDLWDDDPWGDWDDNTGGYGFKPCLAVSNEFRLKSDRRDWLDEFDFGKL